MEYVHMIIQKKKYIKEYNYKTKSSLIVVEYRTELAQFLYVYKYGNVVYMN